MLKRSIRRLFSSKRALALPVTFLILFVSTLGIISVTYYFSVSRINIQSETLKASTARQSFLSLDNSVLSTLWQPGSSTTFDLADSDGTINVQPASNPLIVTVSDGLDVNETIFASNVGKVAYALPCLGTMSVDLYLKGDSKTITNQAGSSSSQLFVASGPEIQLQYRPTVTYSTAGLEEGKAVTNIRIYIVNLNSSSAIMSLGEMPLKISCTNISLTTITYQVTNETENLVITSLFNDANGNVSIPITSTAQGAIINLEVVVSNVSIERWIR